MLLRWCWHRYVFVTIEKIYRQILIHLENCDHQRILWRRRATDDIREYHLYTVTYGLVCAPFLAIRTLRQLADDEDLRFPRGAVTLRRDTYVDNVVTGASTISEATTAQPLHGERVSAEEVSGQQPHHPGWMVLPYEHRLTSSPYS